MNIFKKKMTLIAYLFLRLFRLTFQKEHGKRVSTLLKSERHHQRHTYCSTGRQLSDKKPLLVICQRLRPFVNTMTAVDKCSLPNRDSLMQPIHMQLSQKLKTFFSIFFCIFAFFFAFFCILHFFASRLNFEYFQKKDDAHTLFISEATVCEKRG